MKFTVIFASILSISWALKVKTEDPKGKREAGLSYLSGGYASDGHYPVAAFTHSSEDAGNAVSIGAGYSIGGSKPSFSVGSTSDESQGFQLSSAEAPSGHASIQLAPITLQPSHSNGQINGHGLVSSDFSKLMTELSHGLNSGQLALGPYQSEGHSGSGAQEVSQYSFGDHKLQPYANHPYADQQSVQGLPSYAAGTKGLGSYSSSTGPVLFSQQDNHANQPALTYGAANANSGHALGESGAGLAHLSIVGLGESGHPHASSGHSLAGLSGFGGHGAISLGGGHPTGGHKGFGAYAFPSKASFRPSVYLGGDSNHGVSSLSSLHGTPAFGPHSFSGAHGLSLGPGSHSVLSLSSANHGPSHGIPHSFNGGSSKMISPSYIPSKTKQSFGASSDGGYSVGSHSSPPRTTYGVPTSSYLGSQSASHAASSHSPKYYISSSKYFAEGTPFKGAAPSHASLSALSSGPKYSFSSHTSPHSHNSYLPGSKDIEGSYSENTYNTIKYSEELKPRM